MWTTVDKWRRCSAQGIDACKTEHISTLLHYSYSTTLRIKSTINSIIDKIMVLFYFMVWKGELFIFQLIYILLIHRLRLFLLSINFEGFKAVCSQWYLLLV